MKNEYKNAWSASTITIGCQELLQLPEVKHGHCFKRNNSIFSYLFPCCISKWKRRYLVVAGNYLYRFNDEFAEKTKGVPVPLDVATITRDQGNPEFILEIKTMRKSYKLKFESGEELEEWYNHVSNRKVRSIKERMGHLPVSKEIQRFNQKSDALFNRAIYNDGRLQDDHQFNPIPGIPIETE